MGTQYQITPIPTIYRGVQLKSRMEAQCAYLLDCLQWEWQYEPFSVMEDGHPFTPDFYVESFALVVECLGYHSETGLAQMDSFGRAVNSKISIPGYDVRQFLSIGPDDVVGYSRGLSSSGVRLRFCERMMAWYLEILAHHPCSFCGGACPCAELTVSKGKLAFNGLTSEEFLRGVSLYG